MTPLYAIGDIHGQKAMLDQALDLIHADGGPDAEIVFLGDYTDRGAQSAGVLSYLVQSAQEQRNWVYLKGNHDRMFEYFMEDTPRHDPMNALKQLCIALLRDIANFKQHLRTLGHNIQRRAAAQLADMDG